MDEADRNGAAERTGAHAAAPLRIEDLPEFLRFAPAPVRARRDGWGEGVQAGFILHLARGAPAGEAARRVGRSRQSAYALAERAGAEGFRAAWDEAARFAAEGRAAANAGGALAGIETVLVPRFYRGRLLGFVQREDDKGFYERLARLDRLAARFDLPEGTRWPSAGAPPAPSRPWAPRPHPPGS